MCVHGGLSPDLKTIDQMRTIDRKLEIPHEGPFCGEYTLASLDFVSDSLSTLSLVDLVWSDPEDIEAWAVSPRGAGWLFGSKVTEEVVTVFRKY